GSNWRGRWFACSIFERARRLPIIDGFHGLQPFAALGFLVGNVTLWPCGGVEAGPAAFAK
ncbi:MAG: hypothetical protein WA996_02190, partial [Candidatus Promineifilaceae bacterium]